MDYEDEAPAAPRRRPPADPGPVAASERRPHLDGVRSVAVYLVVLFHAGVDRAAGGFIGVDVFFVLSGYLVTQLLMRDLGGGGSIRFGRFYNRRMRRLLPASLLTLVVTALVYTALATPAEAAAAASAMRASLVYVANWFFVDQSTGYFATDNARNPFLHFWSLAVEEQFYFVWPLILAALLWATGWLGRHQRAAMRWAVAAGAVASATWALVLRSDSADRAYFGTDTRAYQLLAGAFIALSPTLFERCTRWPRATRLATPVALTAVVALASSRVTLDPIERGVAVTAASSMLLVVLDAEVPGRIKSVLASRSISYLGRVSYGTYLWHWPTIIVIEKLADVAPLPLAAIVALVATGIASLSYHLLELPIRESARLDRFRWPVVATGVALSVLTAALIVPIITDRSSRDTAGGAEVIRSTEGFTPLPSSYNTGDVYFEFFGDTVDCTGGSPQECTVASGSGRHLLILGDSNAQMWIPAFTELAEREDLTLSLSVAPGCPWQRKVYRLSQQVIDVCRRVKEDAYERVIPALKPDVIVLINAREVGLAPGESAFVDSTTSRLLRDDTVDSLAELEQHTSDIVIIEPSPTPADATFNPLDCLDKADVVEECRFVASAGPTWPELQARRLTEQSDHVFAADFDRLICPFLPICDPILGGTVVFWNGGHITSRYSRSLADEVGGYLKDQALLPQ